MIRIILADNYDDFKPYHAFPGQVYGWCVCKVANYEGWGFLYWKIMHRLCVIKCKAKVKVRMYFAGFCSMGRGRHWDRRSRYGEK